MWGREAGEAMSKLALIRFGYQDYAVTVDELSATLSKFSGMRKVESRYEKDGYVYWYCADEESDVNVIIVQAERIHATDPGKTSPAVAVKAAPAPDERLIAAPSDINPISIQNVPPMRDFVDGYRDGETE